MHTPPAASNLLLAPSEKDSAQTVIYGTSNKRSSSSTLQTTTAIFPSVFLNLLAKKDRETGYLLTLEWFNLLSTAVLKRLEVLLAKKV